jgi:hypothetical protein
VGGHDYKVIAVRMVSAREDPEFEPPLSGAGSGATEGARSAVGGGCGGGAGGPIGAALCLGLLSVAAITGAVVGAGLSHSEQEVAEATAALKQALAEAAPAAGVERAVVKQIGEIEQGRYQARKLSAHEAGLSNAELAERGFDAVLKLEVSELDLAIFGKIDPDAAVVLSVRANLSDTASSTISAPLAWTYVGSHHDYFDLAAEDARELRGAIDRSYEAISGLIVADLF